MRTTITTAAIAAMVLTATAALAADPGPTCEASKLGMSAKYAQCRLKAESKAAKAGMSADYSRCSLISFYLAESRAGTGVCPTEGDSWLMQDVLDQCTLRVATMLNQGRFVDNGDGTVTDNETGLMWEKKTTAVGSEADYSDPHDVDNTYTWTVGTTAPTGTAFTNFLDKLNGQAGLGTGFAGHYDWRLPTMEELHHIGGSFCPPPSIDPCIYPVFGPTQSDLYWTYSTREDAPNEALLAYGIGSTAWPKWGNYYVRAVRGGS